MTASKERTQTWLTSFEITVCPRPRPSDLRREGDLQMGSADG
jgi:hypothetical protein